MKNHEIVVHRPPSTVRNTREWLAVERAALRAGVLWAALAILALALLLGPQLPLRYTIDVGYEEGYGSDLPLLRNFHTAERDASGTYRWTADGARIMVPGLGGRAVLLQLTFLPVGGEALARGPQATEIWGGGQLLARLPVRAEGRAYSFVLPAELVVQGRLDLTIRTATFVPTGDQRALGARLSGLRMTSVGGGLAMPDWLAGLGWLQVLVLGWLLMRRSLGLGHAGERGAGWLLLVAAALIGLAAWADPPRWALGAWPALAALGAAYGLALALRLALPWLADRVGVKLGPSALGWLTLIVCAAFAMRYGGRLYPSAMHGDIGWHTNRMREALLGQIFLLSENRGIPFPYPPGPYLALAPFTLLGTSLPLTLQIGAALADALSAVLVYGLARGALGQRVALLAAATYVLSAATLMTTWWSFDTHIYSQFFALLAVASLGLAAERWHAHDRAARRGWVLAAGLALTLVFLGHLGFLINTALLVGGLVLLVWAASWRGVGWARALRWPLSLAYSGGLVFALLFFYSSYLPLFLAQAQIAATSGVAGLANRELIERAVLWEQLWYKGLLAHFGFFPVALALLNIWGLPSRALRGGRLAPTGALLALMAGSFAVSACFGALPFVTRVNSSTRWLMFSAWAVAVGAALGWAGLWRRGWAGRLVALATMAVVLWNTALFWIGPMLFRIRPPEPF